MQLLRTTASTLSQSCLSGRPLWVLTRKIVGAVAVDKYARATVLLFLIRPLVWTPFEGDLDCSSVVRARLVRQHRVRFSFKDTPVISLTTLSCNWCIVRSSGSLLSKVIAVFIDKEVVGLGFLVVKEELNNVFGWLSDFAFARGPPGNTSVRRHQPRREGKRTGPPQRHKPKFDRGTLRADFDAAFRWSSRWSYLNRLWGPCFEPHHRQWWRGSGHRVGKHPVVLGLGAHVVQVHVNDVGAVLLGGIVG